MKAAALFDVQGHVALVTGAASGLGRAFVEVMADNGAHVVMLDCDGERLGAAAAELRAGGSSVETAVVDVADRAALAGAIDAAAARHGRLDAVFANAGMSAGPGFGAAPEGAIERADADTFERVVAVNLGGTFATVQAAAPHMKRRRSGRIVITASEAGLRGQPMCGYAYALTKAAVANLARQAALELAPYGVTVNAIAPGPFVTNLAGGRTHRDPELRAMMEGRVPLQRFAQPAEIQGLALLLASPASAYITGAVISIDGGSTAGG